MLAPRLTSTIHIVGIGGIGMSAIAEVLHARGFVVQGSDMAEGDNIKRLKRLGIKVFVGHEAGNLGGTTHVVISSAVKPGNPELDAARALGLTIIRRAEMLAELMRGKKTICITGSHGKTTTTSLTAHLLTAGDVDPTVITGGIIADWDSNARFGRSPWMVVEADESDGTFTALPTRIGVVTNIDPEHLDYFGTIDAMHREFEAFFRIIPVDGLIVTCIDHPVVASMIEKLSLRRDGRRLLTYGTSADADLRLTAFNFEGRTTVFDAAFGARVPGGSRHIAGWRVPIPGKHNALNALAAVAVAFETGLNDETIRDGLQTFSGIKRRFQLAGTWNGVEIIDDYAHNPAKIAAALHAARSCSSGQVIAVVEPHRFTRVRDLWSEFCASFGEADQVIVLPLYAAGETPLDGISSIALAAGIAAKGPKSTVAVSRADEVATLVRHAVKPGDMIIYCGAGRSSVWAHALAGELTSAAGTA